LEPLPERSQQQQQQQQRHGLHRRRGVRLRRRQPRKHVPETDWACRAARSGCVPVAGPRQGMHRVDSIVLAKQRGVTLKGKRGSASADGAPDTATAAMPALPGHHVNFAAASGALGAWGKRAPW
jgi:hypothetical protein